MSVPAHRVLPVLAGIVFLGLLATFSVAQTAPASVRLRGTVVSVAPASLVLKTREGEVIELQISDRLVVNEVYLITLAEVQPGSFIGTAAMPQADGSLRAMAVTVFPDAARGTGEGHRPFDLLPQSTMTNATVAEVSSLGAGRRLQLKYKDGAQSVVVPPEAPIVTFRPGDRSLLVPGASVSLVAQAIHDKPTALRINAGRNGPALLRTGVPYWFSRPGDR